MGHFSRWCENAIIVDFMEEMRNAWRIDAVGCSCGITGENTTSLSKRGDCWANGCGFLSSLCAEGGFCPVWHVMSPPLYAGSVDGSKYQCVYLPFYIITNTMCSSFKTTLWWKRKLLRYVAELQSSWTRDFWALQQLYYFWIYASLPCTKYIFMQNIFQWCAFNEAVQYFFVVLAALLSVINITYQLNFFTWVLWLHKTPEKPTSRLKHQPVFISALYPKSRTRIEIKNFITKISYTHLHFTV